MASKKMFQRLQKLYLKGTKKENWNQ